jgi:hypothetical protein
LRFIEVTPEVKDGDRGAPRYSPNTIHQLGKRQHIESQLSIGEPHLMQAGEDYCRCAVDLNRVRNVLPLGSPLPVHSASLRLAISDAHSRRCALIWGTCADERNDESSRRAIVNKVLAVVLMMASWVLPGPMASAQNGSSQDSTPHVIKDQDLKLLRQDLRSKRKQLIAANLKMTDTEAAKFWPVYDQYVTELIAVNDKKFGLIQEYADNWGKLTNEQSLLFTRNWLDMDIAISQLRQKYVPIVAKVLDGRKTATFFQLDRRIAMMMDLQVSSQIPLVQEQTSSSKSVN